MGQRPPATRDGSAWSWIPGRDSLPAGPLRVIDTALAVVCTAGLALMAAVLVWQVISRYVFSAPTVWSEEFALLLFVWVSMLAVALAVRRGEHLTLDLATRLLVDKPRSAKALAIGVTALMVITLLTLSIVCIQLIGLANQQSLAGIQTGLGLPAKVSWIYSALPVGLGLAAVFAVERLVLLLLGRIRVLNADADQQVVQELEDAADANGRGL